MRTADMNQPHPEELGDGTWILRCRCSYLLHTEQERDQMGVDPQKPEGQVWKMITLNLNELDILSWAESVWIDGTTNIETPTTSFVLNIPYSEFDQMYTQWLSSRPKFKLN